MKHDEFDAKMRAFEKSNDETIRPDMYVIARIDGRNFSTLARELNLEPYNKNLSVIMRNAVIYAMSCGFDTAFGYTQSDEISILMDSSKKASFAGKIRKYNSILPSVVTSCVTWALGRMVNFDCRIIQLPTAEHVYDYFAWRRSDSEKNCLNMWCRYILMKNGLDSSQAQKWMDKKTTDWKNEILFQNGMNFNDIPDWQKRGYGYYWKTYDKEGFNPKTNQAVIAKRRVIEEIVLPRTHDELKDLLSEFI